MRAAETNHQNVCPKCEEMVHRYAARCPYCMQDLSLPHVKMQDNSLSLPPPEANLSSKDEPQVSSKITEMPFQNIGQDPYKASQLHHLQSLDGDVEDAIDNEDEPSVFHNMLATLLPLLTLLAGTFFFFFGLLIKVFSKNGVLVLQWPVGNWPYFVFPSLVLIIAGMVMLSFTEGVSHKS